MSDDDYTIPRGPPGPPLQGVADDPAYQMSFVSADRIERTDPFGMHAQARPYWLDPTPRPVPSRVAGLRPVSRDEEPPGLPPLPPEPAPSALAWLASGMALGVVATIVVVLWTVFGGDDEGLVPLPAASSLPSLHETVTR